MILGKIDSNRQNIGQMRPRDEDISSLYTVSFHINIIAIQSGIS
jgi:hypothetical protein